MRIGIIGAGQSGKSTIFKAIVGKLSGGNTYGAGANCAFVPVPNEHLDYMVSILSPKKIIPTMIEFADVAGVVTGDGQDHSSSELSASGKLIGTIREADALVIVLRNFTGDAFPACPDPYSTYENIVTELTLADLDVCTKRIERIEKLSYWTS